MRGLRGRLALTRGRALAHAFPREDASVDHVGCEYNFTAEDIVIKQHVYWQGRVDKEVILDSGAPVGAPHDSRWRRTGKQLGMSSLV